MIGYLSLPVGFAATVLAVAPFSLPHPETTTLGALLDRGYEVKSTAGNDGALLLLQKDTTLYGCSVPAIMLTPSFVARGQFPAYQIQCTPFY